MLIYGSVAMKHWFDDFNKIRVPNDIDYITKKPPKTHKHKPKIKEEYYWIDTFQYILDNNKDPKYVDKDFLYTIKVSHASWDINWVKTMKDIEFLQSKGCVLDYSLYKLLYSSWEKIHHKKKVKMNVKNKDFFKPNIYRKYNHEYLHRCFAYYDRPLNERIRKDLSSPLCSKDLWDRLSEEDKLKTAKEELYVLTAERYIFTKDFKGIDTFNYKFLNHYIIQMLKQMIISTTSGWFNLYLILNFTKLRTLDENDLIHFKESINKVNK